MSDLAGKVAIVTGGGTGIGKAVCGSLAAAHVAGVVVNFRASRDEAEATASELVGLGCSAIAVGADVTQESQVEQLVQTAFDHFGRLDILVNNAGTTKFLEYGDLDAASDDVWQELLQTNLYGPWYCSRAAAPHLRHAHGSIVNIASMAAHRAGGSSIPYGVSKAALVQLTRGLALALAPDVRVNSVSPGLVRTRWVAMKKSAAFAEQAEAHWAETSPLRRVVTAEDVAEAVLGLIGAKAVTGQDLIVDTGQMILQPR